MGVSTDAQICYGLSFEEGYEFPWLDENGSGEIERWWAYDVLGFKHSFDAYDADGERLPGISDGDVSRYFQEEFDFLRAHPLPVDLVGHCSDEYTMYILAVSGTANSARRGYPEALDPAQMVVTDEQRQILLDFCTTHGIEHDGNLQWWLSSWWG